LAAIAPAVARAVNHDHPVAACEAGAQRQSHVLEIAARAMQQHDWRTPGIGAGRRLQIQEMELAARDLDKHAAWGMAPFQQIRADRGGARE
jgi:hypothetical protein